MKVNTLRRYIDWCKAHDEEPSFEGLNKFDQFFK